MTNLIVKIAYKIESSKSYHWFRTFLVNILINNNSRQKRVFDLFIIFLVISTVGILIYEVKNELPKYATYYELFAIIIFIFEWIGRLIVSFESHKQILKDYEESQMFNIKYNAWSSLKIIMQKKFQYIFSLSSIIDILAILPSYRPLRILRIFLIFRLFKVLKITNSFNQFIHVFTEKKYELSLLLGLYLLAIFFSGTILYIYEGDGLNQKIEYFSDAIYWSFITISTIGYGDITPQTDVGKSVTLILILAGYTVIVFFTSIVTSSITEKLDLIKENRAITNASRFKDYILVCGFGKVGQILVEQLYANNYEVLVIEIDPIKTDLAEKRNIPVIKDDATSIDLLKRLDISDNVRTVVALSNDDEVNLSIILAVRSISSTINILSRCNQDKVKSKLKIAGANDVFGIAKAASLVGLGFMQNPVAFEAIDNILIDESGININEVEIFDTSNFIGKSLDAIDFKNFNITFMGVVSNKENQKFIFNPDKQNYIIEAKDCLIVVAHELSVRQFKSYLEV